MVIVKASNLRHIYKHYKREIVALKGLNLEIEKGEFVSIMGPSGAGKTTTLNLIGLLDKPTSGELQIMGIPISTKKEKDLQKIRKENIGYVFQDFLLIDSLTAYENVALSQYLCKGNVDKDKVMRALELVGLDRRKNHYPNELSGGEMQRVAIARAIVNSPNLILADEPTGNLDTKTSRLIFELFRSVVEKESITVIVATHNIRLGYMANRIIHLVDGEIKAEERR